MGASILKLVSALGRIEYGVPFRAFYTPFAAF